MICIVICNTTYLRVRFGTRLAAKLMTLLSKRVMRSFAMRLAIRLATKLVTRLTKRLIRSYALLLATRLSMRLATRISMRLATGSNNSIFIYSPSASGSRSCASLGLRLVSDASESDGPLSDGHSESVLAVSPSRAFSFSWKI